MSEHRPGGPDGPDDDGLGPPAVELQQLVSETSPGFFDRVRNSIDRRVLGGQLLEQAWTAPLRVVLEYVGAVFGLVTGGDDRRPRSGSEEPGP